ncbi:hypothetical protein QFC21_003724 [Naganishia friedmannii]|uniref:Uncharacterized protein n=1 Tax=Naganishia friedmannii TaxID=89922 RepID=A0ACC2VNV2_9TREE|nr:hypothetical protein QFC21_003724 [Naganishia friedmannii]
MRKEEGTVQDIAQFFYDMKLAGSPLQCNETDGTCEDMELMTTNSVILKTGMFTEWFQAHIVPLRGSPEAPDQGFDEVAQAIAQNGRLVAPTDEGVDFEFTPDPESELE